MRHFAAALLPLLIVAVGGCLPSRPAFETTVFDVRRPPTGSSVDDGVQIDVAFVERPVGDRFLNQGLWEFADEQGINFERKPILEDNGFRAGQVGGQPPPGLQALLNSARTCIEPHRRYLRAGKPATIELGRAWSHCSFTLRQDGRETPVVLDGARCTLEVLPTLTDDGRTTLRFTPVVKHGQKTMEPKVVKTKSGEHNWEMMESEPAETYEWMSWEMTAAPNEFLVIGAALEPYDSLARRSFVYDEGAPRCNGCWSSGPGGRRWKSRPTRRPGAWLRWRCRRGGRRPAALCPEFCANSSGAAFVLWGMNLLELDGSFGEGGGQILRTSLTLALITGRGFHLRNVRAGRDKPGLQPQHLTSVRAAATVGGATARGASRGGTDLVFEPGRVKPGTYRFDVGTAGATGLVLQTVALPLAFKTAAPSKVTLIGGTHVRTSPSFHFLDASWRGYLAAVGIEMSLRLVRAGFYPRGGGEVEAVIEPSGRLHGFRPPERGAVEAAGFAAVAGLPLEIARRMSRRAAFRLARRQVSAAFREEEWAGGPGAVFGVRLATTPAPTVFVGIGELRKSAERVADEVVDEVLAFLAAESAAVDPYSADQLLLPLALAEGSSDFGVSEVTRHLVTNAAVVRNFIDREIRVEGAEGSPGRVRIDRAS